MITLARAIPTLALACSIAAGCSGSDDSGETTGNAGSAGADAGIEAATEAATGDGAQPEAGEDATTEEPGAVAYCDNPEPGFDEAQPGVHFWFDFGTTVMMGQSLALAAGGFWPTAREDYCNEPDTGEVPLDTCTDVPEPTVLPQCTSKDDCAPEQDCLPDTQNGQAIAGSEKCRTSRGLLDVGPFTIDGFTDGPHTWKYNAQQSGAYTLDGTGDGQVDIGILAFDKDYTLASDGSADAGLGALQGTFHFPGDFQVTAPTPVEIQGMPGVPAIEVDPTQDLTLEWTGGDPNGVLNLSLSGGPKMGGKPVRCRVKNDGSFTIEAKWLDTIKLGPYAFVNVMEMRLESPVEATVTGTGLTRAKLSILQTRVVNLQKK